jgi:hypothetical protein
MRRYLTIALTLGLALIHSHGTAAPSAELWERWQKHDPQSELQVDHAPWNLFLQKYLVAGENGINLVKYAQVTDSDRKALDGYIRTLEQTPVSRLNRSRQQAYWINFYNALTLKVILDHYPVDSITDIDISPGFFSNGPWKKKLVTVEGEGVSLDDMEHRILRPIWQDPRVHYAVNCASMGCPNLQAQAFSAENLDVLLDKGAREYVNHPRGARVVNGELIVSSIYVWFEEDFGGNDAGVIEHLKKYARPELRDRLEAVDRIADHEYDWSLNEPGAD